MWTPSPGNSHLEANNPLSCHSLSPLDLEHKQTPKPETLTSWIPLPPPPSLPPSQEPETASRRLISLRQGSQSVAEFSIHFQIAAKEAGWDDIALRGIFSSALNDQANPTSSSGDTGTEQNLISDNLVEQLHPH
ncbi:hypothetical protein ATANTOWER_024688 [Ataeniobius toweri]|uniref:Retrotransposon gag domain-containing protein n=1 Tax=Ataeniobius toweri TaxID=208326 RepID=A0ABU7C0E3_9TELE|nr:hypothetical protein [Ataeniobius toweri]